MSQYNCSEDINMQIVNANSTDDFKLRVVYPQAPFDALGIFGGDQFVYPNDEIKVLNIRLFHFMTLGYSLNKVFITGLNEETTSETLPLISKVSPTSKKIQVKNWEKGIKLSELEVSMEANIDINYKIQITTPKGSFIVTQINE